MSPQPRVVLPSQSYDGYIFDLDGTLVDSMPTHYRAWRRALRCHGAPPEAFRWPEFTAHGGMAAPDIVRDLNMRYHLQMDPEQTADDKRAAYAALLESEQLPLIPETAALVRRLHAAGIPYAIGTGSMLPGARSTLRSAGLEALFPIIVTPDDVLPGRGKPQPDIFLLCAQRMGVEAARCIVFEDAEPGLCAARAAGMAVCRVAPCARPPEEE